jgi:tetratricopeptide (TPR) repeat protein
VKKDAGALAFLRRDPAANGAPQGLATIRELPAIVPAPTVDQLYSTITSDGVALGLAQFDEARARDPEAPTFREAELNRLGYRLLRQQKHPEAIAVLRRNVALYPASSNALDSLAEALETSGDKASALETTKTALDVLSRQELSEQQRADMKALLDARITRLTN